MSTLASKAEPQVYYPESDGKPMAENTIQYRWITTIQGNLDLLFHDRPDVFVAGDNFWYPVKGQPRIYLAPDVYVAFGRPKGDRGSYKQWEEGGIPLSVVFEVMSPSNTPGEMMDKLEFYEQFGVQEYYLLDPQRPDHTTLDVFERHMNQLRRRIANGWVSPLLGIRCVTTPPTVDLFLPDGKPFLSFVELGELQRRTEEALKAERQKSEAERQRADTEQRRAEAEQRRAEVERQRADAEQQRAELLAAKLRELGANPDAL